MNVFIGFAVGAVAGAISTFVFYSSEIRIGKAIYAYADNLVGSVEHKAAAVRDFIVNKAHEAAAKL